MYKEKYFHERYRNKKVDKLKVFVGIKEIKKEIETDYEIECENI